MTRAVEVAFDLGPEYVSACPAYDAWGGLGVDAGHPLSPRDPERVLSDVGAALSQHGFVLLRTACLVSDAALPAACMALVSLLARPIRVFADQPLWREVGVRLDRPVNRSQGIGAIPLHQDFVNSEFPPEYVFFCCLRPDCRGGGATILVDLPRVFRDLPLDVLQPLSKPAYADGKVEGLVNIGRDANPFAVFSPGASWPVRYTGHLQSSTLEADSREAVHALASALASHQQEIVLTSGDLLMIDQRRVLHGRTALGPGQAEVLPEHRRLLRQAFGRPLVVGALS